jgi:four helix bundle protein
MPLPHDFEDFERTVGRTERQDVLWRVRAYQLGRYLLPLAREDAQRLHSHPIGRPILSQLWRAAGSIPANLAEGYSRGTGPDRARFLEYALGSARETIVWYEAGRTIRPDEAIAARLDILDQVKRLLITALPAARRESVRQ